MELEYLGSMFLVLALLVAVALFVFRPFIQNSLVGSQPSTAQPDGDPVEHRRSTLLAERDRILTALQELEFDYTLGKIPAEDYPLQRAELLSKGSNVLRELDDMQPAGQSGLTVEDRIEAAVASRRADAVQPGVNYQAAQPAGSFALAAAPEKSVKTKDSLEDLIATRRRQRQEKASGFCPKCGRPVLKSDKFCSKCGNTL